MRVLPGETDVTDSVGHVAVTGKSRVQRGGFRLLVHHRDPSGKGSAFGGNELACDDVVRLRRFDQVTLKRQRTKVSKNRLTNKPLKQSNAR